MTGLYENTNAIQNDPALTFLLRAPKLRISSLNLRRIAEKYGEMFSLDAESADRMARLTKGYAFAFQALGFVTWEYDDPEEIRRHYKNILDDNVYKKIWEGLSGVERRMVLALPDDSILSAMEWQKLASVKKDSYPRYRERLLNKGVITAPEYGKVSLTLPLFQTVVRQYDF